MAEGKVPVRIDKWLWAARFFKTRALAKTAIETGKVLCNGQRIKPSKLVEPGQYLHIKRNDQAWQIQILLVSHKRGPASEAQTLYEETADSRSLREALAAQKKLLKARGEVPSKRPSKKDRRKIIQFRESSLNND